MQKLTIPVTETTSRRWRGASTLHFHAGERKAARKQKLKEKQREAAAKKAGKAPAKPRVDDDASDSGDDRDYDASALVRAEKLAAKPKLKGKRKRERDALLAKEGRSGFTFNEQDDRFRGLLDGDDRFGVDTSAPEFKKTAGMSAVLEEQSKRRRAKLAKRKQKKKARK